MDRRIFLRSAMYFTVASAGMNLTACGGSGRSAKKGDFTFPLGVASGDPKESSVVFWTRCISTNDKDNIPLRLDVSPNASFDVVAASVELTATRGYDFTVRAKLTNLIPNSTYYYRFVSGQDISAIGQTKTMPAASSSPTQCRFAWMTCQDWSVNHWGAMDMLATEQIDF